MKNSLMGGILMCVALSPLFLRAAVFEAVIDKGEIAAEKPFSLQIRLDPEGSNINGIKGRLVLPAGTAVKTFRFDQSIISLWLEYPRIETKTDHQEVVFAGLIPGGFSGVLSPYYKGARPGVLFSVSLISDHHGKETLGLTDGTIYLNDGKGSEASVPGTAVDLAIGPPQGGTKIKKIDTTAPEVFSIFKGHSPSIFGDRWFVSFQAKDEESGIEYYEIAEVKIGSLSEPYWRRAVSPSELSDQTLQSVVYVRAHDHDGNIRIVELLPEKSPRGAHSSTILGIIIGVILLLWIGRKAYEK